VTPLTAAFAVLTVLASDTTVEFLDKLLTLIPPFLPDLTIGEMHVGLFTAKPVVPAARAK